MYRTSFVCFGLLFVLAMPVSAAQRHIVLKDGTTVEAASAVLVKGQVQLKLENGRFMAFDADDVDLKASGMLPAEAETKSKAVGNKGQGLFGKAIATKKEGEASPEITDQDVKHIWPGTESSEEEKTDENPEESTASLAVVDLKKTLKGGILTVTGSVNNTGSEDISTISLTAIAKDEEGAAVAQGTTGISSVIKGGESRPFAIAMAVPGPVSDVTIKAQGATSNFGAKEEAPASKESGGGQEE